MIKTSKFWAAVTTEENNKFFASVVPFTSNDNALFALEIKNIKSANIYTTKKDAEAVASHWNESYMHNGTYQFA